MDDVRAGSLKYFDLVTAEMNAVRQRHVTSGQTETVEIRDIA